MTSPKNVHGRCRDNRLNKHFGIPPAYHAQLPFLSRQVKLESLWQSFLYHLHGLFDNPGLQTAATNRTHDTAVNPDQHFSTHFSGSGAVHRHYCSQCRFFPMFVYPGNFFIDFIYHDYPCIRISTASSTPPAIVLMRGRIM